MSFGLSPEAVQQIVRVMAERPRLRRAVVFGSRAKGTQSPASDVDIAVWGLTQLEAEAVRLDLEELPLPYQFQVLAYEEIAYEPLRQHIGRVGKTLLDADRGGMTQGSG
ncbi:MAG: nucleotidyltransferase family protein [Myxococcaceae bacterium]